MSLVRLERVLTGDEFHALGSNRVLRPGMAWEMPWIHDPAAGDDIQHWRDVLSDFYCRDWSALRPPINVICPNGEEWCIDQKSIKREGQPEHLRGWRVTVNADGLITCHPSIVVFGYHGFLRDGVFSEDLEGRGPRGVVRGVV